MNVRKLSPALLMTTLSLMACASAPGYGAPSSVAPAAPPGLPSKSVGPVGNAAGGETAPAGSGQAQIDQANRMVIQIATLSLVVKDVDQQLPAAYKIATDLGGFVQDSNMSKVPDGTIAQFTLKVPADRLEKAMVALRAMGEVREEKMTGQDVTAEYADADTQVKNLESAETQLRAIMAKTDKQEDVLKVFNELTRVRGEIEKLKGRMNLLARSVAMATINVSMTPPALPGQLQSLDPVWSLSGQFGEAFGSLKRGMQNIVTLAIQLVVVVLPQLVVVLVPLVLGFKLLIALLHWLLPKGKPAPKNTPPQP